MHGLDFNSIFTLNKTDSIVNIHCHPRFIAALIRLGDLCDVDNGRFNDALMKVFGKLPESSLLHLYKHSTISRLCISANEICMSADIPFEKIKEELAQDAAYSAVDGENFCHRVVYEHQRWFNMIENELRNLLLHAGKIFPEGMDQTLPGFQQEILVNGERSVFADSNLRLNFSPRKAYALIEGLSLYDEQRTFVREIIQNSLDALKIQLWRDLNDGRWDAYLGDKKNALSVLQPFDLGKEIYGYYKAEVTTGTDERTGRNTIVFRDNGIGISYDDLRNNIINTGTSWKNRREYAAELDGMPDWMKPTGGFGIGLHAAFAVTERIQIQSRTRYEKKAKRIIIHSGQQDGFVFARNIQEDMPCGTEITIHIDKPLSQIRAEKSEISPYQKQPEDEFAYFIEDYMKATVICPLFPVSMNGCPVGDMLCNSRLYGAVFDDGRREEIDGIFLAATDDLRMRYIVWDAKAGNLYRIVPGEIRNCICSFKGIFVPDAKLRFCYEGIVEMEALECLTADSKTAVAADRKNFLKEYVWSIPDKKICKPLVLFGEKQLDIHLNKKIGNSTALEIIKLCDKIAHFETGNEPEISELQRTYINQFIDMIKEQPYTDKLLYVFYLAYAQLHYFNENVKAIMAEQSMDCMNTDSDKIPDIIKKLKPQFMYLENLIKNIFNKFSTEFSAKFQHVPGSEFGVVFGNIFGSVFGKIFVSLFNNISDSAFSSEFSIAFGSEFGSAIANGSGGVFDIEFSDAFGSEFSVKFRSRFDYLIAVEFGSAFASDGRFIPDTTSYNKFGNLFSRKLDLSILSNTWTWIIWLQYCLGIPLNSVNDYYKMVPVLVTKLPGLDADNLLDIMSKKEFCAESGSLKFIYRRLPFGRYLSVKEIKHENNSLTYTSMISAKEYPPIAGNSAGFKVCYREIEKKTEYLFCPEKYKNLAFRPDLSVRYFYNGITFRNVYIILPRIIEGQDFLTYIEENASRDMETLLSVIMGSEDTVNLIRYTYLHRLDKEVDFDTIVNDYRNFMNDFVHARLEEK